MHFVPYSSFVIETGLTRKQAMLNLMLEVKSKKTNIEIVKRNTEIFTGELHGNTFKIKRGTKRRTGNRPTIRGKITETFHGSEIAITIRYAPFSYLQLILFYGLLLGVVFMQFMSGKLESVNILFVIIFFGINYAAAIVSFNLEANKAERHLMRIFDEGNTKFKGVMSPNS